MTSTGKEPSAPPIESAPPVDPPRVSTVPLRGADMQPPPPPYQEAVNYPVPPPYPVYQPNSNIPNAGAPHQNVYPPYPNVNVMNMPTPNAYVPQPAAQPTITTHIHTTTVVPNRPNGCAFCTGTVISETDICCLLCLILFTIITFPFGLVFLFCIPCTVRKRCNTCRRLYSN